MKNLLEQDKKCVLYVRVSSDDQSSPQDKDFSSLMQFDKCQQIARKQGLKPIKMFTDSQKDPNPLHRPGFSALMDYLKENDVCAVVIASLDRLTRNFQTYMKIEKLLNKKKIKLFCPDALISFIGSVKSKN